MSHLPSCGNAISASRLAHRHIRIAHQPHRASGPVLCLSVRRERANSCAQVSEGVGCRDRAPPPNLKAHVLESTSLQSSCKNSQTNTQSPAREKVWCGQLRCRIHRASKVSFQVASAAHNQPAGLCNASTAEPRSVTHAVFPHGKATSWAHPQSTIGGSGYKQSHGRRRAHATCSSATDFECDRRGAAVVASMENQSCVRTQRTQHTRTVNQRVAN